MHLRPDINRPASDLLPAPSVSQGGFGPNADLCRYPAAGAGYLYRVSRTLPLILSLLLLSCGHQDDQREFEKEAYSQPSGWVSTNFQGNPTGDHSDPDDWRTAPFFQGAIEIEPAYPNPAPPNEQIYVDFDVSLPDAVMGIQAFVLHYNTNQPISPLDAIETSPLLPGLDGLQFTASRLSGSNATPSGLYRIVLFDNRENIISYGDIMIEP
ncbi:MAG: hypothetical protein WD355_09840 [Balneolaceae bacterium]